MLSFCFYSLVCVLCFLRVWNLLVKKIIKRFKVAMITSFILLLACTPLNLLIESYLYALIFIYDHLRESLLFMRIFEFLLVYDHLWESLLFMRTFLNFFLSMIISKNLFEPLLICDNLWESLFFCRSLFLLSQCFLISSFLWQPFLISSFFITTFLDFFTTCNTIFMKISERMNFIV